MGAESSGGSSVGGTSIDAPARPDEADEGGVTANGMTRWTLHLRFGAGEAPGHEDRARWPSLLLQRAERNFRGPPRPTKNFEKIKKQPGFPLARCYFRSKVHSRSLENEEIKTPTQATAPRNI